ncbi:MAG: TraB/GumN family protein [Sphingomicrobium sp.]
MKCPTLIRGLGRKAAAAGLGLAALFAAPTVQARQPIAPKPAMWVLSDADTTVYLFGTIHLLPKGVDWKGAKLDDALARSDELIIETIIDDKNPMQFMQALNSLANSPNLPPLRERVPKDKRTALDAAVKASGLPAMVYDRMETWAAAFLLLGSKFRGIGLAPEDGVEIVLRKSFIDKGKPIEALETNVEQLGFFDRLPEDAQRSLLEGAIGTDKDMQAEFTSMLDAWKTGDVEKIARTFDKDLAESPALRDALMVQRNRNWAKWIAGRMDQPGSVMIAVGAGHLAGTESVQRHLEAKGYRVQRVQ